VAERTHQRVGKDMGSRVLGRTASGWAPKEKT
jgi:hypothetical protein